MADEKDRLGDVLQKSGHARGDQWARQRDAEVMAELRRRHTRPIYCPQCGKKLNARLVIGIGGMACPDNHGGWYDEEALNQISARLRNAPALQHSSLGEKISNGLAELVEKVRHPKEIDCSGGFQNVR